MISCVVKSVPDLAKGFGQIASNDFGWLITYRGYNPLVLPVNNRFYYCNTFKQMPTSIGKNSHTLSNMQITEENLKKPNFKNINFINNETKNWSWKVQIDFSKIDEPEWDIDIEYGKNKTSANFPNYIILLISTHWTISKLSCE